MLKHECENLPDRNFSVYVVTWAQREPKPGAEHRCVVAILAVGLHHHCWVCVPS